MKNFLFERIVKTCTEDGYYFEAYTKQGKRLAVLTDNEGQILYDYDPESNEVWHEIVAMFNGDDSEAQQVIEHQLFDAYPD